jgi:signal transduction histidine kinase
MDTHLGTRNLYLKVITIDCIIFLFIFAGSILARDFNMKEKAEIFLDTLRNDVLIGDGHSVYQKMEIALSQHEFIALKLDNGTSLARQRARLEFQIFDQTRLIPIRTQTKDGATVFTNCEVSYSLVPALLNAATIWILVLIISFILIPIFRRHLEKAIAAEQKEKFRQNEILFARQVSHDIRSPLSALNMVLGSLKELPEDKRLIIRNATQRINDIANALLQQSKSANDQIESNQNKQLPLSPNSTIMLVALVDAIVSEKRVQYRERMDIEILGDLSQGYGLFAEINATELSRVLSNLINNAVEAITDRGRVTVSIRGYKDQIAIIVSDNGKGMDADLISKLGERGVSHGKEGTHSGSGLGVFHARETIERAGGHVSIQSQPNLGTMITITLPRAPTPKWFVEKINLSSGSTFISADDDQTIHQIWSGRLASANGNKSEIEHLTFSSLDQLEGWAGQNKSATTFFCVDYEFLGQNGNGLDAIERAGIGAKTILVTSRYEEPQVRARAESLGVRILPKSLAPFVPIDLENNKKRFDAILIDDDLLVQMTWDLKAKELSKTILVFRSAREFFENAGVIDPTTPLYIDVSIGPDERGENVARDAAKIGFSEIYLATGYNADAIQKPNGVRAIIGKDPMF